MKSIYLFAMLTVLASAPLTSRATILADLKSVDLFECDLEQKSPTVIRILSRNENSNPGRYFDFYQSDTNYTYTATPNGWVMSRDIDLGEAVIAPLLPKFLYGHEKSTLTFDTATSTLTVSVTPSTMAPWSHYEISCEGGNFVKLDKSQVCPTCLSTQP